jgi:transposase
MTDVDARALSRGDLAARRAEIVRLHRNGVPVMKIVKLLGASWTMVNAAIQRHAVGGDDAMQPRARGRKPGTGAALDEVGKVALRKLLVQRPWQRGLKKGTWSRDLVQQVVRERLGVTMTDRALANYLSEWGLQVDGPATPRARCTRQVRERLATEYPRIVQRAQDEDAEIYWVNEPKKLDAKLWFPEVPSNLDSSFVTPRPKKAFMASVSTGQGKLLWVVGRGNFTATFQEQFAHTLLKNTNRRFVFLIGNGTTALAKDELPMVVKRKAARPQESTGSGESEDGEGYGGGTDNEDEWDDPWNR